MKRSHRAWIYCLGMLVLALGLTLNTKTGLGVSPILSLSYSSSQIWGLNFGDTTFVLYSLFVVGQVGRSYFQEHGIPIDVEFLYTAQNPTVSRARDMGELMLDLFWKGSWMRCTSSLPK